MMAGIMTCLPMGGTVDAALGARSHNARVRALRARLSSGGLALQL